MPLVILVNAFLALSVDKLSEIRDLEEDESKEKASEEKERKQREEQLSALKNPKMEVRRRTIRRMLRLQASNPKERVRSSVEPAKNKWWKQFSLPHFIRDQDQDQEEQSFHEFKRSVSSPSGTVTSISGEKLSIIQEDGGVVEIEGVAMSQKRRNPLSLVQNPSSYFDSETLPLPSVEAKDPPRERSGLDLDNPLPTASSTRLMRVQRRKSPPPVIMEEREGDLAGGDSVFEYGQRQMSVVSSPANPTTRMLSGDGESQKAWVQHRAHSLPVGGGDLSSKVKQSECD